MIHISSDFIEQSNNFTDLVNELQNGFCNSIETPKRHHHDYANPSASQDSTLLLMPSWQQGKSLGVKIVTVSPDNGKHNLPSIHGVYLLFDAENGTQKALLEGKSLTSKRTAAASALASRFLSRKNAKSLFMIGTGDLAPNLIKAHCSQRPIERVYIWGRSQDKALAVVQQLHELKVEFIIVDSIDDTIPKADIISCATLSPTPLIKGRLLQPGQHVDLVGSYKKNTREADDETLTRSSIFVDTYEGGLTESGDLVIPLEAGIISHEDISAEIFELSRNEHPGRTSENEITVFKSVGHASEDLIAANYYFNLYTHE